MEANNHKEPETPPMVKIVARAISKVLRGDHYDGADVDCAEAAIKAMRDLPEWLVSYANESGRCIETGIHSGIAVWLDVVDAALVGNEATTYWDENREHHELITP